MKRYFLISVALGLLTPALSESSSEARTTLESKANQLHEKLFVARDMRLSPEEIYANAEEMNLIHEKLGIESNYESQLLVKIYQLSNDTCDRRDPDDYQILNAFLYSEELNLRFADYKSYCLMKQFRNCEVVLDEKLKERIEELEDNNLDHLEFLEKAYPQFAGKFGILRQGNNPMTEGDFGRGMLTFLLESGFLKKNLKEISRPEKMREFLKERMMQVKERCMSIFSELKPWPKYYYKLSQYINVTESEFSTITKWVPRINLCTSITVLCNFDGLELHYRDCLRPAVEDFKKFVKHD